MNSEILKAEGDGDPVPSARESATEKRARRRASSLLPAFLTRADPLLSTDPAQYEDPAVRAWAETRLRRINRWRRPLTRRRDRLRAWANMLFVDHGIIRAIYPNFWQITPRMWRSSQPLPHHIRRFAAAGGKTVVTLRGGQMFGSLPLEAEACAKAGLDFHTIVLRSRDLPERDEMLEIMTAITELSTPVLFHCKSGADRAGFMAALWMIVVEGKDVEEARHQLSLRYGHVKESKTGILDAFFDAYERDTAPGGPAAALGFRDWVAHHYDREAVRAGFQPRGLASLITDVILRRE
ncbi:MAG: sulfur transferase domain-containing protein [Pseudomonadota bacterium]